MSKIDLCVFIGRFQPVHSGHLVVIDEALSVSDKVCVIIGSAYCARSFHNPFTADERATMMPQNSRIHYGFVEDYHYNLNQWLLAVQEEVAKALKVFGLPENARVALIGHSKDHSSFYLKKFPQWDSVDVRNYYNLSATNYREEYFTNGVIDDNLPQGTKEFLDLFKNTSHYKNVREEHLFIKKYKQQFEGLKYPPIFTTVDSCVIQSGHVLLIQRKARPGLGLFGLPGGFLNANEYIIDAAIRELREETKLKVPTKVLLGSIKAKEIFDEPNRSARGRTITHGFLFHLDPSSELPEVKGGSDAKKSLWTPINQIRSDMIFEDHMGIINHFVNLI